MHQSCYKTYFPVPIIFLVFASLIFLCSPSQVQAQRQRGHQNQNQNKAIFPFHSFSHIPGFSGTDISSDDLAAQLRSISSAAAPEYQEQPQRDTDTAAPLSATANRNELGGNEGGLPLYKQSYPGLYVKGHAPANFKYEPTRQVEHHHGPDYQHQFPRGISSSHRGRGEYEQNPYSF